MIKVEASTLEGAYKIASEKLSCSVTDLEYEIVQYPSSGILGFLKKKAIIVVTCNNDKQSSSAPSVAPKKIKKESRHITIQDKNKEKHSIDKNVSNSTVKKIRHIPKDTKPTNNNTDIVDNFFQADTKNSIEAKEEIFEQESIIYDELALVIENQLKELFSHACFEIDIVEVDVRDNTALIFIDGNDAALLIGKEGYRYNALSYMIFNWLHAKYELFIKLEIAEFLTTQQEMIRSYIVPVIENVEKNGKGKTRFLDGILVQIALEQLRERFPNKYVAVKTSSKDGKKFVVINEFNNNKK